MAVKKWQPKGRKRKEKAHEKRMTENSEDWSGNLWWEKTYFLPHQQQVQALFCTGQVPGGGDKKYKNGKTRGVEATPLGSACPHLLS